MKQLTLLSIVCASFFTVRAQNSPPQVENLSVTFNASSRLLWVSYDLIDAEVDQLEVIFQVSDDSGSTYTINASDALGDVGYPVMPGSRGLYWTVPNSITNPLELFVKVTADDRAAVNLTDLANQVDENRLWAALTDMEGIRHYTANPTKIEATKDTLHNTFERNGLYTYRQPFSFGGGQSVNAENIIGKKHGLTDEQTVYIIDAHFDGVSAGPAADDNASGTAGVIEAAKVLSKYEFERSIKFIGFDLEEAGLVGSSRYVTEGIEPGELIAGVLNLEMIGYYTERPNSQEVPAGFDFLFPDQYAALQADQFRGNFITNVANEASEALMNTFDSITAEHVPALKTLSFAVPGNGQVAPDMRRSDHAPFWDAGFQALMLTDGSEFRNENYHTALDVSDSLDIDFMTNVTKASIATIAHLAGIRSANSKSAKVSRLTSVNPELVSTCGFMVEPNPAKGKLLQIKTQCEQVEAVQLALIYDLNGKLVAQHVLHIEGKTGQIKLPRLAPGQYILDLQSKNGNDQVRFNLL